MFPLQKSTDVGGVEIMSAALNDQKTSTDGPLEIRLSLTEPYKR